MSALTAVLLAFWIVASLVRWGCVAAIARVGGESFVRSLSVGLFVLQAFLAGLLNGLVDEIYKFGVLLFFFNVAELFLIGWAIRRQVAQ